jgi:8-amino-7-oxononanoate synthase
MTEYNKILDSLAAEDNLRELRTGAGNGYINLSSNDYLGLGGDVELQKKFLLSASEGDRFVMSNLSSRLVTGNSEDYDALENAIAKLYPNKKILVAGSGYLANTGVLPALTEKGDTVLADKLVHASIIDGLRLCECDFARFRHNDMAHLEALLQRRRGGATWVVTESLFSMDGDFAPLRELVELKKKYDFRLYVDEAHAFGVCGPGGAGCAADCGADGDVDVLVGTFGKALASYGAFVATSPTVREVLVNRMRTLIFSTALPPVSLQWSRMMVEMLPQFEARREHLRRLSSILGGQSHIVPLMAGSNAAALKMASEMREEGFWVTPIRYPTVPRGAARIRISLSAALGENDIERFAKLWKRIG